MPCSDARGAGSPDDVPTARRVPGLGPADTIEMGERWRWLDQELESPYLNVALEEALFRVLERRGGPPTVRVWRNPTAVVVGASQEVRAEVDVEACLRRRVPIIRRFTGGGTVYHDPGNLNYTFCVGRRDPHFAPDLRRNYEIVSQLLVEMLGELGLEASFRAPNGVYVRGRKVCGLAGRLGRQGLLLHGTLLVASDLEVLRELLELYGRHPADQRRARGVRSRKEEVTNLAAELGRPVGTADLAALLEQAVPKHFGVTLVPERLGQEERELAERLLREKYATVSWIFHARPPSAGDPGWA
ncbi:MAG: lipoate--protein ligase family protein [Deltaproteobacteria bacterium]|nr:lipoate--protein ligase family protein [Deltaproteobacteria bacterium]